MEPMICVPDSDELYHFYGTGEEGHFDAEGVYAGGGHVDNKYISEGYGRVGRFVVHILPPKCGLRYSEDVPTYVDQISAAPPFEHRYTPRHVKNIHRLTILEGVWEGCKSFVPFKNSLPDGYQGVWDDPSPWLGSGCRFMEVKDSESSVLII